MCFELDLLEPAIDAKKTISSNSPAHSVSFFQQVLGPRFTSEWLQDSVVAHIPAKSRSKSATKAKKAGLRDGSREWAEFQLPKQAIRNLLALRAQWTTSKRQEVSSTQIKAYMAKKEISQLRIPSGFKGRVAKLETWKQKEKRLEREEAAAAKGKAPRQRKVQEIVVELGPAQKIVT